MKILISAFAFAPNTGSEGGVGWRWAMELAKDHEVFVVTDVTRQPAVAPVVDELPSGLTVLYFRPPALRRMPLNSTTAQLLYALWQVGLYRFARRLHREHRFDMALHLTYSVFRHPSFLGFLGIPFVFGPLGGGEDAPFVLKRSIHGKEKVREVLRSIANKLALLDPFLWASYRAATVILVSTEDTRRALPWPFRKRAIVYSNLGVDAPAQAIPASRSDTEPLKVLFAGRLLGWKGVHLAIRAVASAARQGVPVDLKIVGNGTYLAELSRLAVESGVGDRVSWEGHVTQQELFSFFRSTHCLLFPSLHDSGGSVVLEAQAHGVPIVCLDLGGPRTLSNEASAIVVPTAGADEEAVVAGLSSALVTLYRNESARIQMGWAGIRNAGTMSWEQRVRGAMALIEGSMARDA